MTVVAHDYFPKHLCIDDSRVSSLFVYLYWPRGQCEFTRVTPVNNQGLSGRFDFYESNNLQRASTVDLRLRGRHFGRELITLVGFAFNSFLCARHLRTLDFLS